MNCQMFESVVSDLARAQMIEAGIREQAQAHCHACSDCARKLADQQALTLALRNLVAEMQSVRARVSIEQSLKTALRSHVAMAEPVRVNHAWRWGMAVAAALLILFAIGLTRWREEALSNKLPTQNSAGIKRVEDPGASPTISPEEKNPKQEQEKRFVARSNHQMPQARPTGSAKRQPGRATSSSTTVPMTSEFNNSEIATEFLPLGYGNSLNLQDGGQIVRVEMPRSTLVNFGLPINMNRVSERVKADVLLGADGSARAIRFVQ